MTLLKSRIALVVGGAGALGRAFVNALNDAGFATYSLDLVPNVLAQASITISPTNSPDHAVEAWKSQLRQSRNELGTLLHGRKLHSVFCTAGGWIGGSIWSEDCVDAIDYMHRMNLQPAVTASHLALHYLGEQGFVVLTGAAAALQPCPGMIGYGLSKAASHHLVQSLAADTHLPERSTVVAVLPDIIDTQSNREAMPGADYSSWTKVATLLET
jgi:dihydropteridine reductase